jgi:hypothetical protein
MADRVRAVCLIFLALAGVAGAGEYDFFRLSRYPEGGKLRPEVDLYEVIEPGGAPQEYRRRVVQWWPRRGVDIIAVDEGMPQREWTFQRYAVDGRTGDVTGPSDGELLAWGMPRTFRAHLIGFDGIGNDLGDPYAGEDFFEPSVILRMADGSKRSFQSKTFCQADREFILDVYVKEMKRITGTLDQTEYSVRPQTVEEYPGGTPIGQPGSLLLQSKHFVVPSGSQAPGGENDRWLNDKQPEVAARLRACVFNMFEHMHAYLEYGGHLMPYWDRPEQYKYEVHVGGTILDGYKKKGGGAGGGYGAQGMGWLGSTPGGFGHEYGHGQSIQWEFGDGEILAQAYMELTDSRCTSYAHNILVPWRNCAHAEYNSALFYRAPGFDPNWGLLFVTALPASVDEPSIFQTLARIGQQRGMFEDGIRGLGDMVGDYSARLAEFDMQIQYPLRIGYFAAARNYLETVDAERGIYRIPWDEAPEPFGANIVRLLPEEGSEAIEVDFQGYHDPAVYSDWRACIVAVDKDGKARYSDLWSRGRMVMPRRAGDRRYWLTVAATPSALLAARGRLRAVYQGRHAPRYPWQVTLQGAAPGTPHRSRSDLDDVYGVYGREGMLRGMDGWNPLMSTILSDVPRTEAGKRFVAEAKAAAEALRQRTAGGQALTPAAAKLLDKLTETVKAADGAPHPNGGGWVAATAEVAPTAYVGPDAMVLGNAKVLDRAVVEDYAVVKDNAVVSEHARVGGQAMISNQTKLSGYQRAWMPLALAADQPAPDLTPRLNEPLDENGLWAHYAMDQAETMMLEDYYRQHAGGDFREFFVSLMNGYLHGQPGFVEEDGRRGFAFDGTTQYAELNRRIADLPEITVDMAVKWRGEGEQTLLDFGSGIENHFALTTGGPSGRLRFTALVDGREMTRVIANQPLPGNAWTRVRLEIDGQRVALWLDDQLAGETATDFRPADVFRPGEPQRNFLATARDGSARLKGVVHNVVVYHKVHGEAFAELPPPHRDAPRRPEKGFAKGVLQSMGASPFEQADRAERYSAAALHDWHYRAGRAITHLMELKFRVPEYMQAVEEFEAFEQWKNETSEKFRQEFLAANEGANDEARRYADEKLREAGAIEKELAVNDRLEKVHDLIREKHYLDYHVLCSFIRQNFHGFYNSRISSFISGHARKLAGGDFLRDNLNQVREIEDAYTPENWKTSVRQWDWRTRWEKDGSIQALPLTQKWLLRVRGAGPLPQPPAHAAGAEAPLESLAPAQQVKLLEARLAQLEQVEEQVRAAVAAMPETKAAEAEIARLQQEIEPLEEMAKTRLNELRQAEATDPQMVAWKRAESHIRYSKEWKRVIRALEEARGRVHSAYQHTMREELKARDAAFRKWSDLNDQVEELRREQIYRLHDYVLRHTEHPNLLGDGGNRGELEETRRMIESAKRALREE